MSYFKAFVAKIENYPLFVTYNARLKTKYGLVFMRAMRAARIAVLSTVIYNAGHTSGISAYAADPYNMDQTLTMQIASTAGAKKIYSKSSEEYKKVAKVGNRVLKAFNKYCDMKLEESEKMLVSIEARIKHCKEENEIVQERIIKLEQAELYNGLAAANVERTMWLKAKEKLQGDWNFIVIDADSINVQN